MMTNLFSIFDPSTPHWASLNWVSAGLVFLALPKILSLNPVRQMSLINLLSDYLLSQFNPLIKMSRFTLIFIISLFIIIMYNNSLGLLPYIFTASGHLVFTLSLALPCWIALMLCGWTYNTANLLAHLIPRGTPVILMPFMVVIETVSNLIRPMTLAVRLSANMIAGHLLIVLLSSAFMTSPSYAVPLLLGAQLALSALELAVAFIQAYVFSVLITLYMAEAV